MTQPIGTIVDSSVLLDLMAHSPQWTTWSEEACARAANDGPLIINPIIYVEVSTGFDRMEALDVVLSDSGIHRHELPYEAGFLAGKAFVRYRRRGGAKTSPLPDFYIGAHAVVRGYRLLTRDVARVRDAFPSLTVMSPS